MQSVSPGDSCKRKPTEKNFPPCFFLPTDQQRCRYRVHHLRAAMGTETIDAALSIRDGKIHPTIHDEHPDRECDLGGLPNKLSEEPLKIPVSISGGGSGITRLGCEVFSKWRCFSSARLRPRVPESPTEGIDTLSFRTREDMGTPSSRSPHKATLNRVELNGSHQQR